MLAGFTNVTLKAASQSPRVVLRRSRAGQRPSAAHHRPQSRDSRRRTRIELKEAHDNVSDES